MSPVPGGRIRPLHASPGEEWLFGRYRLVPASRRLYAGGRSVQLDARALAVLECLLGHAQCVVPRSSLIAEAWPGADLVVDSTVSKAMRRLRLALGDSHGTILQTVYGEGYRLALPATLLPGMPGAPARAMDAEAITVARAPAEAGAEEAPARPRPRPAGAWQVWLPWTIATLATLLSGWLAWLLLDRAGPA